MKKIVSCLLVCIILSSAIVFSGCSADVTSAENVLKVYFSSLSGFNTNAMKTCIVDEKKDSTGFKIETMSDEYIQTDNYKKSVERMYKALGQTFDFNIKSNEVVDKKTIKFTVKFKYANVDDIAVEEVKPEEVGSVTEDGVIIEMQAQERETKMDKYCREQLENYIARHPSMLDLSEIEYSDKAIGVIANAYEQYLQITTKIENEYTIVVSKKSGEWKIHTDQNKEFFDLLTVLFG